MSSTRWTVTPPSEWRRNRVKYLCRFVGGGTPDKAKADYWGGEIPWVSPKDMKSSEIFDTEDHITDAGLQASAARLVEPGAVLIVMRSGILQHSIPVAINRVPVTLNQDMRAMLPSGAILAEYLARLIEGQQKQFLEIWRKEGTTVESLESDWVADTEVSVPPVEQQHFITAYLDRETARLDELVTAKERLLELLVEKRRTLITRAVTRGLNDKARLRDSGVAWLGDIPAHWDTERSKWLFRERDERSSNGDEEMLTVSHLTGVTPRSEKDVNMFEAESNEGYKVCYAGDLVINTLWAWMGAMGVSPVHGIVSPAYNVYEPGERLDPAYVDALVRITVFAQEATRFSKGVWSSRLRLYPEGFFDIWMPVPPLDEQRAIADHISSETAKLDTLRSAAERTLGLLKERRSAIIAAAVTGQMKIPEAV